MNFARTLKRSHWTGRDMSMRESFQKKPKAIVTGGYCWRRLPPNHLFRTLLFDGYAPG
jgi:hypothetical protein